jgi:exopolyphosphatase/guanosine-5'-triphosphate,3'-diphosphate pyrophosphatase
MESDIAQTAQSSAVNGDAPVSNSTMQQELRAVLQLAAVHGYEAAHAHRVAAFAQQVFDELAELHRLSGRERFLLRCAAILHDIARDEPSHHKAAQRIVLNSPDLPFDLTTRRIIGLTARYHRKALPALGHRHFAALNHADREIVIHLAGILRVADALDTGHEGAVKIHRCEIEPRRIVGRCSLRKKAPLEFRNIIHERTISKGALLEKVTGRRLTLEWVDEKN